MRRVAFLLGAALVGFALLPNLAQAQVIVVERGRTYAAPVIVNPPVTSYYLAPSVTTYGAAVPTYSYYSGPSTVTYSAPPVVTYSGPAVVTYATPVVVTPRVVETRSYYGFGIFRPRGTYVETRVYP
jgi:hypothetical protein